MDRTVTFAESADSCPVGGSAAHVIEAGSSQLVGGVRPETCTVQRCFVTKARICCSTVVQPRLADIVTLKCIKIGLID